MGSRTVRQARVGMQPARGTTEGRMCTMAKGGPESDERERQKLISVVAVGASESVSRNQLIKCDLLKLKNGEM